MISLYRRIRNKMELWKIIAISIGFVGAGIFDFTRRRKLSNNKSKAKVDNG